MVSRKNLLRAAALAAIPGSVLAGAAYGQTLEPTPYCDDGDDPTPPQMEGPYFKPNSPRRTSMLDGTGTRLTLTGVVYGLACQPLANCLLDFWQADSRGVYDNTTYRFRGHQFSTANGTFSLTTVVAGLYPGRTRHIHVKVQAPGRPILTTQLYFPGEPRNNTDSLFNPKLLMAVQTVGTGRTAQFDFVLNVPGTPPTAPPTTRPPTTRPPTTRPPTSSPTSAPGGTWAPYTAYALNARVTYGGLNYRCQIAHTSLPGWEPPNAPALWARV